MFLVQPVVEYQTFSILGAGKQTLHLYVMNATFEALIKLTSSANCLHNIIPIYYETQEGEGVEDVQDQLIYNGFNNTASLSAHLNNQFDEIKHELTVIVASRSMPKNALLDMIRQAEISCKVALKNFYTLKDSSGKVLYHAHKIFRFSPNASTAHLAPLENIDFTHFHEAIFAFLIEVDKYCSDLANNIAINYNYEQQEVVKNFQPTGFELQNPIKDSVLVNLLYTGLLDAALIVQGKTRFNSVFSNKPVPVPWRGEINQLAYLINQLKGNVPEILIPTKSKWVVTGHCFKIEGRPYPIPTQVLKDAERPKNTKAIDAIILELSKKRPSNKLQK